MDKQIKKVKKNVSRVETQLSSLAKQDKKRDPACEKGKKMMAKKKK